jgi:hypothetical protein
MIKTEAGCSRTTHTNGVPRWPSTSTVFSISASRIGTSGEAGRKVARKPANHVRFRQRDNWPTRPLQAPVIEADIVLLNFKTRGLPRRRSTVKCVKANKTGPAAPFLVSRA